MFDCIAPPKPVPKKTFKIPFGRPLCLSGSINNPPCFFAILGQAVPETSPTEISIDSGSTTPSIELLTTVPWGQNLLILKKLTDPAARTGWPWARRSISLICASRKERPKLMGAVCWHPDQIRGEGRIFVCCTSLSMLMRARSNRRCTASQADVALMSHWWPIL